jgi:uncharacterized protein
MSSYERPQTKVLIERLKEKRHFIQVLLGPRQVGKSTIASEVHKKLKIETLFISGDNPQLRSAVYLEQQWNTLRTRLQNKKPGLLIIDEVHKFDNWSEIIKNIWDEDTRNKANIKLVLLGSAPLLIQDGLGESLFGRFEVIQTPHWSYQEMNTAFNTTLDQYIFFGSYPGSAKLIKDEMRFKNYVNDSIIETTLSRDIMYLKKIEKPALLRRLFQLSYEYSGQILTYQKMLGQLQDAGNTTTLAHYLDLLSQVGMACGLQKFSGEKVRQRASPPKLQVYNNALMTQKEFDSFLNCKKDSKEWGRRVESAVGSHLLNQTKIKGYEIYYWREGDFEVDFILKKGSKLVAIEVKSGLSKPSLSGLEEFKSRYPTAKVHIIGDKGIPFKDFFLMDPLNLF